MKWNELCKAFLTARRDVQAAGGTELKRQIISLPLALLVVGTTAQAQSQNQARVQTGAQTGDWQVVAHLMPGTEISVKTEHRYHCMVESVTDDELYCKAHLPRTFRVITLAIRRSEVNEIRISPHPNQAKDAWIGAGIGATAGAVAAGTNSRDYPGFNAFVGGLGGAAGGAFVGATIPIFQLLFQRGKLIYKR